jgi:hypothetical protein
MNGSRIATSVRKPTSMRFASNTALQKICPTGASFRRRSGRDIWGHGITLYGLQQGARRRRASTWRPILKNSPLLQVSSTRTASSSPVEDRRLCARESLGNPVAGSSTFLRNNSNGDPTELCEATGLAMHLPHSSRMSVDGSTASARAAGTADAAMPSSAIVSTAPPTTTGSRGLA